VVESILQISEKNRFSKGIFSWVGFNTHYLPYVANERMYGESKWNFFKLFKYALSGIISFSTVPLKVATWLGTMFSIASIVYFIVVFCQRLFTETPIPGYATMVCLILLIGGIQLFCLGIIGEYLARTYVESKNRPVYIIKKIYSND
jgi:glycosyltransferase involved in cell wall biosynthesis